MIAGGTAPLGRERNPQIHVDQWFRRAWLRVENEAFQRFDAKRKGDVHFFAAAPREFFPPRDAFGCTRGFRGLGHLEWRHHQIPPAKRPPRLTWGAGRSRLWA